MKIPYNGLAKFIEKYFFSFGKLKTNITYKSDSIIISFDNKSFENLRLFFDKCRPDKFFFKNDDIFKENSVIYKLSIKLLDVLNKKAEIPLTLSLEKDYSKKSIFIVGTDGKKDNLSQNFLDIISKFTIFYTNNVKGCKLFLTSLGFNDKEVLSFEDLIESEHGSIREIIMIQFGDFFDDDNSINLTLEKLRGKYDKVYIGSYYSNFIHKYSLSNSNYGNFYYLGTYNDKNLDTDKESIISSLNNYISYTENFNNDVFGGMLKDSSFICEFTEYQNVSKFFSWVSKLENIELYNIEIIFEEKSGYYNIINTIENIDITCLKNKKNITNISVYIYKTDLNSKKYLGLNKYNSYESDKIFTFLSAPLSNTSEFTEITIDKMKTSKVIFGESLEGTYSFFENLNINSDEKKIYYGDDIKLASQYLEKNNLEYKGLIDYNLVPKYIPELELYLKKSEKITFLSDGGVPCIQDPGEYIKKYIRFNYQDYSIIGYKGPNVISSVVLGSCFSFKKLFWAPLLYSITPGLKILKDINFFSKNKFKDTLIVFYSFGSEINKNLEVFEELFDINKIKIQLIADIGGESEYNKVYEIKDFNKGEKEYIKQNLVNVVYLIKYF